MKFGDDEFFDALHALSPEEARALIAEEVKDENGRTVTLEHLLMRSVARAARCPSLSKELRDRAFFLAKDYVRRTTPPVVFEIPVDIGKEHRHE